MDSDDLGAQPPPSMDDDERQELVIDRRQMLKRAGLGAAALSVPAAVMATPAMGAVTDALAADSFIKSHPKWKFVFVNHVTTNPFFVPTIYGLQDACSVLGCSYQFTGSTNSDISQMVNAMNAAITAKADGIGVCLVSLTAFNGPTNRALGKGIPVLSYNADAPNARLAYIASSGRASPRAKRIAFAATGSAGVTSSFHSPSTVSRLLLQGSISSMRLIGMCEPVAK